MAVKPSVIEAIGNTPLIRLKGASEETGCEILGKAEFMNPGQSVKDRAGLFIIQDAIEKGQLRPGGVIVEGTAGNTGIGITMIANALGYRSVIVIPETQSQEKKDTLRLLGAQLVEVPAVPYRNVNNYVKYSQRLAEKRQRHIRRGFRITFTTYIAATLLALVAPWVALALSVAVRVNLLRIRYQSAQHTP